MQFKRTLTALASAVAIAACGGAAEQAAVANSELAASSARGEKQSAGVYVVRMIDPPVTAYTGGINGLRATRPAPGTKIDPNAADVLAYVRYLDGRHTAAVGAVGGRKLYDYRFSFNGFAARLTPAQAQALAKVPGVLSVSKDEIRKAETSTTPTFLGLNASGGLWDQLGTNKNAGEGIIIGIVDSGIWPENPSFSDRIGGRKDGKLAYLQIPGWHGRCVPGEGFTATLCNQKLIGAQYFNAGVGGNGVIDKFLPWEFNSVRDYNGHGSHTAATAGGNADVVLEGPVRLFGSVSGIAPRARIAAYKALWDLGDGTASGSTSDLVAAIDQAVADGVDVINYSVSGSRTNFIDDVEIAFLNAAAVGVFVATSAGNSGPANFTVAHPGPWLTTVAAGTHTRGTTTATVTLGNGVSYTGPSTAAVTVASAPFVDAAAAALAGANALAAARCYARIDNGGVAVLDPAKVAGKIVLCERGTTNRVNKSLAVKEAGGIGMVLINVTAGANSLVGDFHSVPSVHLSYTEHAALKAYAATAGATATIGKAVFADVDAPFAADFSSRGPLLAGNGDLLKPDLIAPGQDILAAVSPQGNLGLNFSLYSGTSMSSPHVAGLAALLKQARPGWSPMAIKSALMTTAYDIKGGANVDPAMIFAQGAGHVAPNKAVDPGLVYDSSAVDWIGFLCGTQLGAKFCTDRGIRVLQPSNFNSPSIAINGLVDRERVTRTVRNVTASTASYTAEVSGLAGFDVAVEPSTLTLDAGKPGTFSVTAIRTAAPFNAYTGGYLTWRESGGTHVVRIPVVVRPVALVAPAEVDRSYSVTFGYDGPFTVAARGLISATETTGTVEDDPTDGTCSLTSPKAQKFEVTVPAGTTYARFATFDADVTNQADLDLCVFIGETQVGLSAGPTAAEQVSFVDPTAATYTVVVQGWGVEVSTPFALNTWLLGSAAAGNMTVTAVPETATMNGTGVITLQTSGLAAGRRYLGSVAYGGVDGMPNPTIVRIDTPKE